MVIEDDSYPPRTETIARQESIALEDRLATPLDRIAAGVADFVLISPVMALAMAPFRRQASEALIQSADDQWLMAMISACGAAFLIAVAYQTFFLYKWRATPGKRLFGLTVESLWQDEGDQIRASSALLRSFIWCLEACLLGFPWIAVIGNERRRPFHDRISDTIVLSKMKSKAGPPGPSEMSLASGLVGAFFTSALIVATAKVGQLQLAPITKTTETADNTTCDLVDRTQSSWMSGPNEKKPSKLSVAITLYETESINESCLKQIADTELWQTKEKELGYLARGLAEKADEELAQDYFDKACDGKHETDACKALAFLNHDELPDDPVEANSARVERENDLLSLINGLTPKSEPFLKILAIRELTSRKQSLEALAMIDSFAPQKNLSFFLSSERMKTLWALGRKSEARLSMKTSIPSFDSEQRVAVSRWFCQAETSESGCTTAAKASCDLLSASVESDRILLGDPEVTVAYLRGESCAGRLDEESLASLKEDLPDITSQNYVAALDLLAKGKTREGANELKKIADGPSGAFTSESQARLADLARTPRELTDLREEWTESDPRTDGWIYVGRHLMDRYNTLKAYDQTIEVGFKMGENDALDQQAARSFVVAAYRTGQLKMAAGYYQSYFGHEAPNRDRLPASNDDGFEQVVRELKADVRGRQ